MKNILTSIFCFYCALCSATNYYVSSAGNDSNSGLSTSAAWKTIAKVNSKSFSPGDVIYFNKGNIWREALKVSASGTASYPIIFGAYGTGANPLIDAANSFDICIILTGRSYITIDGIDCKNARVNGIASPTSPGTHITIKNLTVSYIGTTDNELQDGIYQLGGYLTVDNCTVTRISHCGIMFGGSNNTITNNRVSYTSLYCTNWGAGINGTSSLDDISYNTIDNCGGVGALTKTHGMYICLTNSQVHHNTITNSTTGAGIKSTGGGDFHHNYISNSYLSGIATGTNGRTSGSAVTINIYYNILTGNRQGVSESDQGTPPFSLNLFNNTFYSNNSTKQDNFYQEIALNDNINTSLVIKNNIVFGAGRYTYSFPAQSHAVINNNCVYEASGSIYYNGSARSWSYWQGLGFDLNGINTNPGLVSPPSNFRLNTGSPAIGAGTNVGLTSDYVGTSVRNPPSIGAYESGTVPTPAPAPVVPVYVSSVVTNATPSLLELTYNTALANISPATSAFLVKVNSVARTVTAISISGTKVLLTLISPILSGDVVTVSYTKPSVNPLQTASSGQAESLSAQSVTVTVSVSGAIPAYISSVVSNATPSLLEMNYNLTLANVVPATSSFVVLVNSVATTVNTVKISGTKVQLTLSSAIRFNDVVTVSYNKPANNPLQTVANVAAPSISNQSVTNNLVNPVKDEPISISLSLYQKYVHRILNATLTYSKSPSATLDPQFLRISNLDGILFIEKLLATGTTYIRMPINLRSGIYIVKIIANGKEMASQKMYVY